VPPRRWLLHVNVVTADGAPFVEALPARAPGLWSRCLRALAFPEPLPGNLPSTEASEIEAGLGPFRDADPIGMRNRKALPKQTLGVLALPPDQPVHVALLLGSTLVAQLPATPGQEEVTFVLGTDSVLAKTCTVHFRCLDHLGTPVTGARVSVGNGGAMSTGTKMVTDAEGRFTATGLMPGLLRLGVWHQSLRMPPVQVEIPAGTEVDFGDITLQPGVELELAFDNFGGKGGVYVFWLDAPARPGWRTNASYHGAENGSAQKASLFPGRYGLVARSKNGVALLEIDTAALPPQPIRFDLRPGASLRLDNRVGAGFVRFEIATRRGVPCIGERWAAGGASPSNCRRVPTSRRSPMPPAP
jgi:hypothetical protein